MFDKEKLECATPVTRVRGAATVCGQGAVGHSQSVRVLYAVGEEDLDEWASTKRPSTKGSFAVRLLGTYPLHDIGVVGDLQPVPPIRNLPEMASVPDSTVFLEQTAVGPFLEEVKQERLAKSRIDANAKDNDRGTDRSRGPEHWTRRRSYRIAQDGRGPAPGVACEEKQHARGARPSTCASLQRVERVTTFSCCPHQTAMRWKWKICVQMQTRKQWRCAW